MRISALAVVAALLWPPPPAHASGLAAIVEDVGPKVVDVAMMDYLEAGRVLWLAPDDWIVISYLRSCLREKITGGKVTVGDDRSIVVGGAVQRDTVDCDAGKPALTDGQGEQAAGFLERGADNTGSRIRLTPKSQLTLYGASPIVMARGVGSVTIERLGGDREREELPMARGRGGAGYYDFAQAGRALVPGAVYRATAAKTQVVFRIHPGAKPGTGPLAGRLILFETGR